MTVSLTVSLLAEQCAMPDMHSQEERPAAKWGMISLATAGGCMLLYAIWLSVSFELWFDKFERATADVLWPAMNLLLALTIMLNIAGAFLGILAVHRRERYLASAFFGIVLNAIPLVIGAASAIYG